VAPQEVTQAEVARALAASLGRPQWLSAPAPLLRALLGDFADLLLASQRVQPTRLKALGFRFARPDLASALER
jgi:NAD dependent epimerase/dehydratase family enzyme